jgi:hypothetical protein
MINNFPPWRWRRHGPRKRWYISARLYDVLSLTTVFFEHRWGNLTSLKIISVVIGYFPCFECLKVGLCDLYALCVSHPTNYWMVEAIFIKLGMCIVAPERISKTYFINPSHQSVCLCMTHIVAKQRLSENPCIVAQRLGENVTAAVNTNATIEDLLGASFLYGPCRIKESRRLVLPRGSCFNRRHAVRWKWLVFTSVPRKCILKLC